MRPEDQSPRCRVIGSGDAGAANLAAELLREGGLVALPTETVYGLAADMCNHSAIERVFRVKNRPTDHPLIVHIDSTERADEYAARISPLAHEAMEAFWPGPLTVLLQRTTKVDRVVTGGRDTVALRNPANIFFRSVIGLLDRGVVAPSANRFGHVSPTRATHVQTDLGGRIDLIVDGGDTVLGLESTIIDLSIDVPQLLRHGALPKEEIESTLGITLEDPHGPSRAPGMLNSHYAPRARVHLVGDRNEAMLVERRLRDSGETTNILQYAEDLPMYASTLYQQLRNADDAGIGTIIAIMPLPVGLGRAIADRLRKAAVTPFQEQA